MVKIDRFAIPAKQFTELIIQPMFNDVLDGNDGIIPSTEDGDWMMMDGVTGYGRPILDFRTSANVTKRRDATCKLIFSPVGKLTPRSIFAHELYAASENCAREFYQGDMEDFDKAVSGGAGSKDASNRFFEMIMPTLEAGVRVDTFTNRYFGDTTRQDDPTGLVSWNKYDGIFTYIGRYIDQGVINNTTQTFAIPSGTLTPQQAYDAFLAAYNKQPTILKYMPKADKAFYVDENMYEALFEYYRQGNYVTIEQKQEGGTPIRFKGIEIRVKQWDAVLAALNSGTEAHALILTLKGNFLYGYDSAYTGKIPGMTAPAYVWFDDHDMVWKYLIQWTAGTQIASPENMVVGVTANAGIL